MGLDLSGILDAPVPANDAVSPDLEGMLRIMTEMQRGIATLTEIVAQNQARVAAVEIELRRIKARTDAPRRPLLVS